MTIYSPHVVHAHGSDSFHARVNLGRTNHKTATATNTQHADASTIYQLICAQIIDRSTKILGVNIGRNRIMGLAFTFAPK